MDRKELEKLAEKFGVKFTDETSDEELLEAVEAAQKKAKKDKDPEFLESELKKVIAQRDAIKKERRAFKAKIDQLKKELEGKADPEELKKLREELEELKNFKTMIDKEKEEEELKKLDEIDRIKVRAQKEKERLEKEKEELKETLTQEFQSQLDDIKKELESSKKHIQGLRKHRLESEIIKVASKKKAIKPEAIFRMLKDEFEYDPDLDKFIHPVRDKKGKLVDEKDVDEFVSEFLDDEENDYLISADVNKTGLKTKQTQTQTQTKTKTSTPKSDEYDPNDPEIIKRAEEESMSVEAYIEVCKKRDAKLKLIEERRRAARA